MGREIDYRLSIDDEQFQYLHLQKGSLDPLKHDRNAWAAAYIRGLRQDFEEMKPYLPIECSSILDVGSGLGGIDIILQRHYESQADGETFTLPALYLMDGVDDKPVMELHRKTFNNARVAKAFMMDNDVPASHVFCIDPADKNTIHDESPYDVILSLGSWCFHYAPATYLDMLVGCATAETIFVLDVRRDKGEWIEQLTAKLKQVESIRDAAKFDRGVYRLR